jgi:hypothetical protein
MNLKRKFFQAKSWTSVKPENLALLWELLGSNQCTLKHIFCSYSSGLRVFYLKTMQEIEGITRNMPRINYIDEEGRLRGCCALRSCRNHPTFQRCSLPSPGWWWHGGGGSNPAMARSMNNNRSTNNGRNWSHCCITTTPVMQVANFLATGRSEGEEQSQLPCRG